MKLAPFTPYQSKPTPDTRLAITRQVMTDSAEMNKQIIQGFVSIIAMEGPTLSNRLFTLYAKKGGFSKLSPKVAKRFYAALKQAVKDKTILMELDTDEDHAQAVLWLPSMEKIVIREYGNRGFDDIPTTELADVMLELASEVGENKDDVFQALAKVYGLNHIPKGAEARLDTVFMSFMSN